MGAAGLPLLSFDSAEDAVGRSLSAWRPGMMDIHHLSTGRGDATLVIGPAGDSLLIDAGDARRVTAATLPQRPDSARPAGEWIGRYVRRRLVDTGRRSLDQALFTHMHADHIGGAADLERQVGIDRVLDAEWPDYLLRPHEDRPTVEAYAPWVEGRTQAGRPVERFQPGRGDQLRLGPGVQVRNLAARGEVWTGAGEGTRWLFPREGLNGRPEENAGSAGLRIGWGRFRYFIGGDLTDWADAGGEPALDVLTPAAEVCGPVDVAVAPHHGLHDASGAGFVRALRPRVWIISAWHASHPSSVTLERFLSEGLNPGAREVYATALSPAADLIMGRLTERLSSRAGHVVVRVAGGGATYRVVVVSDADEAEQVLAASGWRASGPGG